LCAVAGGYVEAMGMRLLRGRGIDPGDVDRSERVAVVNQAFVDTFFPGEDPIGHRVRSNAPPGSAPDDVPPWLTIVGVESNTPVYALAEPRRTGLLYMPMSIAGGPDIPAIKMLGPNIATMSYIVRSTPPSMTSLRDVRRAVDMVDPNLAIAQARSLEEIVERGSAQMSFTMVLLTIAAGVALMLGVIGIYGVVSYIVSQRTAEIGIRLALGAEPRTLMRMIIVQSGRVTVVGIMLGIVAALAGGRMIESLLFDVKPRDPLVLTATALTLLAIAILACWLPARRVAHLNPIEVLRMD
jgi:putative ABC transport system permease protein